MMKLPWKPLLTEQRDKSQEGIPLVKEIFPKKHTEIILSGHMGSLDRPIYQAGIQSLCLRRAL